MSRRKGSRYGHEISFFASYDPPLKVVRDKMFVKEKLLKIDHARKIWKEEESRVLRKVENGMRLGYGKNIKKGRDVFNIKASF